MSLATDLGIFDEALKKEANNLENLFTIYFTSNNKNLESIYVVNQLINLTNELEKHQSITFDSTKEEFPDGHPVLTKALVYFIKKSGIDKDYTLNRYALALLQNSQIRQLAHQNNHALIYYINKAVNERIENEEREETLNKSRKFLVTHYKSNKNRTKKQNTLARFLYALDHPHEELGENLNHLITDFGGEEDFLLLYVHHEFGKRNWNFSSTVYEFYRKSPGGLDALEIRLEQHTKSRNKKAEMVKCFLDELRLVDRSYVYSEKKTNSQSRWMALSGFAVGIEIAMIPLENLALMSSLSGFDILWIFFASCFLIGSCIALFFHSAHYKELKKLNRSEYYEENLPPFSSALQNDSNLAGSIVAKGGTGTEAAMVASVLLMLGVFAGFDMISWGIKGGAYTSALPGTFFFNNILKVADIATLGGGIIWAATAIAVGILFYVTWRSATSLFAAHYALDGQEAKAYFKEQSTEAQMRGVINKDTREPLFFSKTLEWKHKASKALEEFQNSRTMPILTP